MSVRKLDWDETDFMRDYVQEGVDRGETEVQIQSRRRELTEIIGCTIKQVAGAVAWKKRPNADKLVLEPLELSTDAPSHETLDHQQSFTKEDDPLVETVEEESTLDTENERANDYERMDYDYETKRRWRGVLLQSIKNELSLPDPQKCRVLFFPGRHCHEAGIYKELAIPGNNLVGFIKDGDPEVIADYRDAAKQLGIDGRVGDLEQACEEGIGRFNIVSLDFPGEICDKYARICGKIELEDRSIVIVNTMGKREKGRSQVLLGWADKSVNGGKFIRQMIDEAGVHSYCSSLEREEARKKFASMINEKSENVANSRVNNAHVLTVGSMGSQQVRNWMFSDEIFRYIETHDCIHNVTDPIRSLRSMASLLAPLIGRNLAGTLGTYSWDKTKINNTLSLVSGGYFLDTVFCRPHLLSLKKYQYTSDGISRSPFNTDIAVLDIPRAAYAKLQKTAHFLLQCFLSELLRSNGSTWFETEFFVRSRQGWRLGEGARISGNDRLVFAADNKTVCDLRINTFFEEAEFHSNLVSQYSLDERNVQAMIPREIIQ